MSHQAVISRFILCASLISGSVAADTWFVREDGVGSAKIAMTLAQLSAVLHEKFSMPSEKSDQGCFYVSPRGRRHISFMIEDGRLVRVDVDAPGISTSSGIQVGDSEAHAREVYGSKIEVTDHKYIDTGHYLTARSADGRYGVRFETDKGKITMFYAGTYDAIQYV